MPPNTSQQSTPQHDSLQKDIRFVYAPPQRRLLCSSEHSHAQLILAAKQNPASFTFHGMLYPSRHLYYVSQFEIEREFKQGPPPIDFHGFYDLHAALHRHLPWARHFALSYRPQLIQVTENGCVRLFEAFEGNRLEEIIEMLSAVTVTPTEF